MDVIVIIIIIILIIIILFFIIYHIINLSSLSIIVIISPFFVSVAFVLSIIMGGIRLLYLRNLIILLQKHDWEKECLCFKKAVAAVAILICLNVFFDYSSLVFGARIRLTISEEVWFNVPDIKNPLDAIKRPSTPTTRLPGEGI